MKPFGMGSSRFDYLKPTNNKKATTIDFNQMVSVKDKEIYSKRMAFLHTITMHKNMAHTH